MRVDSLDTIAGLAPQSLPVEKLDDGKRVKKNDLINILNYVNFQEGTVLVNFRNKKYGNIISIQAKPLPCGEGFLSCMWNRPAVVLDNPDAYDFENFLISDGQNLVIVTTRVLEMDMEKIVFILPDLAYEKTCRRVKRHDAVGIAAKLLQNGVMFQGRLVDFSAASFCIELSGLTSQSFHWINSDQPVNILFEKDGRLLYSGECVIIRQGRSEARRSFVLAPHGSNFSRFRKKEYRCLRHHTVPPPNITFRHPLTDKRVFLQVVDISSTGFAVEEYYDSSVLLPGTIIPEIALEIASNFVIKCSAQVLYRNVVRTERGDTNVVRCGIALLDMDIRDQARLSALLHQAMNPKSYVCNQVDMDALWQFFFESGFIYPSKYTAIEAGKEEFKKTYEKLYQQSPSIARHFIFQDKGQLFGHMSMVRFYANSWMIHHHAASKRGPAMAGVTVLEQVSSYVNEFHTLLSTHMNFVICYFRPDNKFPARVFGGVAADIANPKGSSVDTFGYLHLPKTAPVGDSPYQILPVNGEDLAELERYYENVSGGLMLDALDLKPDMIAGEEIALEYNKLGFKRERHVFSLKQEGRLKAVIMVALSDMGLNLSNLTNCIHAVVIDGEGLSSSTLLAALHDLGKHYSQEELALLVYPCGYLEKAEVPFEKKYSLWVLNMQSSDGYFRSLRKIFKRVHHGG
jgi:hypothetical protein